MIDIQTAAKFLDFGARIGAGQRANEQLEGAVAIHNLLAKQGVAYLADEVGMGKTYVALGALAIFRHFQPDFRVLIIAPRENIQNKWIKEFRNFVAHNVRFPDMRVKSFDNEPAKPLVAVNNLLELVREVTLDRDRDFFLRLTSFSLPLAGKGVVDPEAARRLRDGIRESLPWLNDEVFDLRSKQDFKDNFARALCCALPTFDLVIIDEGHNLKHGFSEYVSARNRVLGLAMGHRSSGPIAKLFPGFGPRARRVLFLSATPVEETYRHLWNQLSVFGLADPFQTLNQGDAEDDQKKVTAAQFLIRRVTSMRVAGEEHTKNLYRRDWRRGGVQVHDEPIRIEDAKERLVVALVQKKVSELLGHERFNSSFQIGMLASFESFLETTRLKRDDDETRNFDDTEQTANIPDIIEREGVDVSDVNKLGRSYRQKFGTEMPHPKMDALVDSLTRAWTRGEKSLVFVRRVASVKELKRKLDDCYNAWLQQRLLHELPESTHPRLKELFERYQAELAATGNRDLNVQKSERQKQNDEADSGGSDTFFAWFFRGEGPPGVISGANIQKRFIQRGTEYSTFFEDNHVADVLECRPGNVQEKLAEIMCMSHEELRTILRERSKRFLTRAQRPARADRFEALQGAAIELLKDQAGSHQEKARFLWSERYESALRPVHAPQAPEIGNLLEVRTFFTEIRERPDLREKIWPKPRDPNQFREQALRAQLLASAARLGHGLIDLYTMTIRRLGSLELRTQDSGDDETANRADDPITDYLELLELQMKTPIGEREWGAFDELSEIALNHDLILDVNEPEARHEGISTTARLFGRLLGRQQPIGGMSGQVNQTLVRQFRMPGYPLVLVTTDLLQEGEDLHTFCSSVHHYGISWTPSSMEQRIGRIDRVRSHTDRRISALTAGPLKGEEKLQVYFPHLEDTVEVLQVHRVLERMNVFLRLMHEGLITGGIEDRSINTIEEFARVRQIVPQFLGLLKSSFPVQPHHLEGDRKQLAVGPDLARELAERFTGLGRGPLPNLDIVWQSAPSGGIVGTARLGKRQQQFTLFLKSVGEHQVVRCTSPVGRVGPGDGQDSLAASKVLKAPIKIVAIKTTEQGTYDLTVEGDVLLAATHDTDSRRVSILVSQIVRAADALKQECALGQDQSPQTSDDD